MANIQHKDITDPNIHEPKGAQFAEKGTAYVADGNGSGSWQYVVKSGSAGSVFPELISFSGDNPSTFVGALSANFTHEDGASFFELYPTYIEAKETGTYSLSGSYSFCIMSYNTKYPYSFTVDCTLSTSLVSKKPVTFAPTLTAEGYYEPGVTRPISRGESSDKSLLFGLRKGDKLCFYADGYKGDVDHINATQIISGTVLIGKVG